MKNASASRLALRALVAGALFFILALPAVAQPAASSPSGSREPGLDADYSHIARLRWMGPGEPGTYAEYIEKRKDVPFRAAPLFEQGPAAGAGRGERAMVLVNTGLLKGIQDRLAIYVFDLCLAGYAVEVYTVSGGSPADLKGFLLDHKEGLAGCAFVGDVIAAWYEMDIWEHEEFPCDLYFMELDGDWTDSDSDGLFDGLTAGSGDQGPEIFIGRIDASMMNGDEAELTNAYFDKVHAYRARLFTPPHYGLTYTEDDWASLTDMRTNIKYAYPDFDDIPAPATTKSDYMTNRIPNPAYEFIQLACHSSSHAHYFTRGGAAYWTGIINKVPQALFYNLFCCSSLRFTDANFLGGAYIYNTSQTSLAVIGSTKTGSMLSFRYFYEPFGANASFGESFKKWFDALAPYNNDERAWHFGMTVAGDPFLAILKPVLVWEFPDGLPQGTIPPGPEVPIKVRILDGDEEYLPGTAQMHYRMRGADPFQAVALEEGPGGIFEAVLPAAQPGDEPQFYFSAEGSKGDTAYYPEGGEADPCTLQVCFDQVVLLDDFEQDQGWTVENIDVLSGEWERADPVATSSQPEDDHSEDGTLCYVTGYTGIVPSYDDVDGGPTRLISPALDFSQGNGRIGFYLYFFHSNTGVQQPLEVEVSDDDGATWTKVMDVGHAPQWTFHSFMVGDFVQPSAKVRVRFSACDNPDDDIVEALVDDFEARILNFAPSLWAGAYALSVSAAAEVPFFLDAGPSKAGRPYLLLGSLSGTSPGTPLPSGTVLPLNWDAFSNLLMHFLETPVCQDFLGILDASGRADAQWNTCGPLDPGAIGLTVHFAYLLGEGPGIDFASNPIQVDLTP